MGAKKTVSFKPNVWANSQTGSLKSFREVEAIFLDTQSRTSISKEAEPIPWRHESSLEPASA